MSPISAHPSCPQCHAPLPEDAPQGLCPDCLMAVAALQTDQDTLPLTRADFPTLDEIATAFPDLEIVEKIGQGGMGIVFKARQPKLDRTVALKVLPKTLAATPGFPERFKREGRVLARLNHPSIVTVYDFGESGGFCYLLMEHVDGVNLRQAMRAGRFTPDQALKAVPDICTALQYAHEQGVLHRDIKPENILLDSKGRVKIADFGIAKLIDETGQEMLLTQSGAKLGTAPYMAPEQIEQPSTVDHRADIYSLGVVLYELLTGELPLGRFAAPSEKSAVNGNVDEVVFRALEKERGRRQQSAGEFKTQIESLASMPQSMQRVLAQRFQSFEYKSKRTLFGMPLLHVTSGIDPTTGRKREARGFFAFGDIAIGVFAFGGYARGWFACGGVAMGGVAIGGVSLGLISWGGLALALLLAVGGLSIGPLATGGAALGWNAVGAFAMGWNAVGGVAIAQHGMGTEVIAPHVVKSLSEMSPTLQFMAKSAWWVSMGSFLWLPLMLPTMIVPWWARRQLEFQSRTSPTASPPSTLVFWTIPALLLVCAVFWWMLYRWTAAGADMARYIIPTVISSMGILLYAFSLPLWLRLVPMNSWYGVRLPSTFLSDERWYEVNAHFGKHLFWWSLAVIGAGIAGFYQLPRHQDSYPWAAVTLSLVAVAASVISTLWWMHQNPVGTPKPKRGRLAKLSGQVVVATVIALFIRAFIVHSYSIPNGGEPGVAKGSYWLASRLNTGFAAGELIAFQHESGRTWLARVVTSEDKGLRLKRGGSPDEFFMPWDKIVGKMWFSYLSPDALAIPSGSTPPVSAKPTSVNQGTAIAVDRKPELVALRIRSDKQQWTNQCFDPFGNKVSMEEHRLSVPSPGSISENGHDGWLQLWFSHPDFDSSSMPKLKLFSSSGLLQSEARETLGPEVKSGNNLVSSAVMRLSHKIQSLELLPKKIRLVLRYSVGPWSDSEYLSTGLRGTIELRQPCQINAIGETEAGTSVVAWTQRDDSRQFQCLAVLKNGSVAEMDYSIFGGGIQPLNAKIEFTARLAEINYFEIRSRLIREVTFSDVVLPPLPKP